MAMKINKRNDTAGRLDAMIDEMMSATNCGERKEEMFCESDG